MPHNEDDYENEDRPRRRPRDDDNRDLPPPRRKSGGPWLILGIIAVVLLLCGGVGIGGIYYAVTSVRTAANRMVSQNNLRQIGLAMENYHDTNDYYPNDRYAGDGKPLLSWRVELLPYIEADYTYRMMQKDQAWDSPANSGTLNQMSPVYRSPIQKSRGSLASVTYYRGFTSPGAVFARHAGGPNAVGKEENAMDGRPPIRGLTRKDFKDGLANTIVALEAGDPIEWSKPVDLDASPGKAFPPPGGARDDKKTVMVLFADGSVRAVNKSTSEATWRAGVTFAGNDVVNFE